jgi:putative GTP pyrophosphokinase
MSNDFLEYFRSHQPAFKEWGEFIITQIKLGLQQSNYDLNLFLRIPTDKCRLKEESSAIGKIARKGYNNPINQMKDLVGVRFVVLLTEELKILEDIVLNSPYWNAEKDNDFQERIEQHPEIFDYQSIHYILTAKDCDAVRSRGIPNGLPCEVQLRTLLQHAYAELTHDNIYKPTTTKVSSQARRLMARSMALMESTDDLFCRTLKHLKEANSQRNRIYKELANLYTELIGEKHLQSDEQLNLEILDIYSHYLSDEILIKIKTLLSDARLQPRIVERSQQQELLFSQPVVLFIYWLVSFADHDVKMHWNYQSLKDQLTKIYSDLGIAFGD